VLLAGVAAGCASLMLLAFRKTTPHKTGGTYRDTLRPLLIIPASVGLAASATALYIGLPRAHEITAVKAVLVGSSILFLFLLLKRGRKEVLHRQEGDADPFVRDYPTGGKEPHYANQGN
jgi:hypothetical protein